MSEFLDVLDENGKLTGKKKLRTEVHKDGDWHKTVHIWIFNKAGEILLQRRCKDKDSFPNMLDLSVGGHITAGDTSVKGAIREVKEEIGIDIKEKDLKYLKTFKHNINYKKDFINNQFEDVYILEKTLELEELRYQKEEISELIFVDLNNFKKMIDERNSELIIRDEEFEFLFKFLKEINRY